MNMIKLVLIHRAFENLLYLNNKIVLGKQHEQFENIQIHFHSTDIRVDNKGKCVQSHFGDLEEKYSSYDIGQQSATSQTVDLVLGKADFKGETLKLPVNMYFDVDANCFQEKKVNHLI